MSRMWMVLFCIRMCFVIWLLCLLIFSLFWVIWMMYLNLFFCEGWCESCIVCCFLGLLMLIRCLFKIVVLLWWWSFNLVCWFFILIVVNWILKVIRLLMNMILLVCGFLSWKLFGGILFLMLIVKRGILCWWLVNVVFCNVGLDVVILLF